MVEDNPSRRNRYTPGERAWWTSCVFRSTLSYASNNAKIRELLEVAPGDSLDEHQVLQAARIIFERYPVTWDSSICKSALTIQLKEVSKKAGEVFNQGRFGLSESGAEARRLLGIEYEDIRTRRHPALEKLERFIFAKYDQQTSVSP